MKGSQVRIPFVAGIKKWRESSNIKGSRFFCCLFATCENVDKHAKICCFFLTVFSQSHSFLTDFSQIDRFCVGIDLRQILPGCIDMGVSFQEDDLAVSHESCCLLG